MKVGSNGDQLTILGWFSSVYNQLDRFIFADGSVKSSSELLATLPMYAFSALPLYENGTSVNDELIGYEGVDIISGGAGNNTLYGCGGNDTIFGGAGNDILQAGAGDDLLDGGIGTDNLAGDVGNDTLSGGTGSDLLDGGTGDDTYIFNIGDGADTINNYDTTGVDTVFFGAGIRIADIKLVKEVNNLTLKVGSNGDQLSFYGWFSSIYYQIDRFTFNDATVKTGAEILATLPVYENGTAAADTLTGYEGVDIMSGGAGADYLSSFAGNDTLSGGEGNDNLLAGDGDDLLDGGWGIDNLSGNAGNDILIGGAGNDTMDGGVGNDTYIFNLGDGSDIINNGDSTGLDVVSFGAGITLGDISLAKDGYSLLVKIGNSGDQLTIGGWFSSVIYQLDSFSFANGSVISSAELLASFPMYENGSAIADTLTGYEGVDIMTGGDGADTLYGLAGNDTLLGGDGKDNLIAGDGDDLLDGGFGDDTLTGGNGNDLLTGGMGTDNLTGDAGNDKLVGGVGSDNLDGGAGNDTYAFNLGDGADTISNFDGADTDIVSFGAGIQLADINLATKVGYHLVLGIGDNGDQINLNYWFYGPNYQVDCFAFSDSTVKTGAEILAGLPVYENGTAATDYLYGYEGRDIMSGGAGSDNLSGYAGNDTLTGGDGNDTLTGGTGNDTFVFNTLLNQLTNKDTITDFVSGQDKIALDKNIFNAVTGEGFLASNCFLANATGIAGDDNDYILYNTTSGALLYDADGSGQGVAIEFATLTNRPTITADDFFITS